MVPLSNYIMYMVLCLFNLRAYDNCILSYSFFPKKIKTKISKQNQNSKKYAVFCFPIFLFANKKWNNNSLSVFWFWFWIQKRIWNGRMIHWPHLYMFFFWLTPIWCVQCLSFIFCVVVQLHKARSGVVHPNKDAVWKMATMDLVSDEEDAILDGRPVWVVRPPSRSTEISALCAVLQKRLEGDKKYVAGHHRRVSWDVFDAAQ